MFRLASLLLVICIITAMICATFVGATKPYLSAKSDIIRLADVYDVSIVDICSICAVESGFNNNAVSKKGAVGIMQLMPSTAAYIAQKNDIIYSYDKLTDREYNLTLGCLYYKYISDEFSGDWIFVAYNAGESKAKEWRDKNTPLDALPYKETKEYLLKIKKWQRVFGLLVR